MNRVLRFAIPYDKELIRRARTVPRARLDKRGREWVVQESRAAWLALEAAGLLGRLVDVEKGGGADGGGSAVYEQRAPVPPPLELSASARKRGAEVERERMDLREALMREGAAYATVRAYVGIVRQLQNWWGRPLREATRSDLLAYQTFCIERKRYGRPTMNQVVDGIRAYYERVLEWEADQLRLPRQKRK